MTSLDRPPLCSALRLVHFLFVQVLVTSIKVNKDTVDCDVQPLDLITVFDGKPVEGLSDKFEQCFLKSKTTQNAESIVWVARMFGVPPKSDLQSE